MTYARIHSLGGTGSTGDGLNHSYLLAIREESDSSYSAYVFSGLFFSSIDFKDYA